MANKKVNKNGKNKYINNEKYKENNKNKNKQNIFIMKILVFLGVIIFGIIIVWLMNYFFVEKNNLKINMSTDKKVEYIVIANKEETLTSQKFISDLGYSMRYDINNFKIFKYKSQDIYRFINAEKIMVVVENSELPNNCKGSTAETDYNNCVAKIDDITTEYYISNNEKSFKISVRTPNDSDNDENVSKRIKYMLDSFIIN